MQVTEQLNEGRKKRKKEEIHNDHIMHTELLNINVMLLQNISIQNGLRNGTRLEVIAMHQHSIEVSLISGALPGSHVLIPRMKLAPRLKWP